MPRRRNTGSGSVYKRGRLYWIAWNENGARRKESAETDDKEAAQTLLAKKLVARSVGKRVAKGLPLSVRDLVDLVLADYTANTRKSYPRAELSARQLVRVLGEKTGAGSVDEATITAYVATRQGEEAAAATINRELACLRRAFRLAVRARRLERRPDFSLLKERNARKGFFEEEQFRSVLARLDEDVQPVVLVAYHTGWRVRSEILTRERRHLDLKAGWLRLEPGETKNGEGRMFPLFPELKAVLGAQEKRTKALEQEQGRVIPWLFHRQGEPMAGFRGAWAAACKKAGLPGKLLHDFRRTAVRNMERRGVPRAAAMAMVGHLTESIYRRYAIVDESVLKDAAKRLTGPLVGRRR